MTNKSIHKSISGRSWRFAAAGFVMVCVIIMLTAFAVQPVHAAGNAKYAKATVKAAENGTAIRKKPSIKSEVITRINAGEEYKASTITFVSGKKAAKKNTWFYLPKFKGYIRGDTVSVKYKTKAGHTNRKVKLRKGAGNSFASLGTVKAGTEVKVQLGAYSKDHKKWRRVKVGGKTGYLPASAVDSGGLAAKSSAESEPADTNPNYITKKGFPKSYIAYLDELHKQHPSWKFTPVKTGLKWEDAFECMTSDPALNLTYTTYADSFKSTAKGCYNYLKNTYVGKDGDAFIAADKDAVAYYMDPRNFLTDETIFMFESNEYHDYQNAEMVQRILKSNKVLKTAKAAKYFVDAGKKYNVSPVYLASRSIQEIGSSTDMVNGKNSTYPGVYNVFNIGAGTAKEGGALNGLKYAKKQGWTTLKKAVFGGAKYIRNNYVGNSQYCAYLEHFNVLNGLDRVGTHVYMTAVYAPLSQAYTISGNYATYGFMDRAFEFYIPVYSDMPDKPLAKPSGSRDKDNNYYLKTLKVSYEGASQTLISDVALFYDTSFTVHVPSNIKSIKISAAAASKTDAKIKGKGTKDFTADSKTYKVKCTSSSGKVRTYSIKVVRD